MVKVYPNEVNLFQLAAIGNTPGIRTATTPFGMPPGSVVRYIGKSVPWKGLKGDAFWKFAEEYKPKTHFGKPLTEAEREKYKGILADALRMAIDISKRAAGNYGIAVIALQDGRQMVVPRKVAKQMELAGKPVTYIDERVYGENAYMTRKRFGIKGEYKALVAAPVGAIALAAPR